MTKLRAARGGNDKTPESATETQKRAMKRERRKRGQGRHLGRLSATMMSAKVRSFVDFMNAQFPHPEADPWLGGRLQRAGWRV